METKIGEKSLSGSSTRILCVEVRAFRPCGGRGRPSVHKAYADAATGVLA